MTRQRRRVANPIVNGERKCYECNETKSIEKFPLHSNGKPRGYCLTCHADYFRKRTYGITPEMYAEMLVNQKGVCAICETWEPGQGRSHFAVDHCHKTNKIRGLLCLSCNIGMGNLKDSIVLLEKTIAYLKECS